MNLAVISGRLLDREIFWRNCGPPLEDNLAALEGATLVAPPPLRRGLARPGRAAWLSAIRAIRQADAVFWMQMHLKPELPVWASAYVRPGARRGMLALDAWEPTLDSLGRILASQQPYAAWVHYTEAYERLSAAFPKLALAWLPMGFNESVFVDKDLERDIYVFWMGRRLEPLHRAILDYCEERGLTYRFSQSASDPATNEELSSLMARSRYFVVTPPQLSNAHRTGSFSPLTMRYIEGPAAGCRLLGIAPRRIELDAHLPTGSLVEVAADGSDLASTLEAADSSPEFELLRRRAHEHVWMNHTWAQRAVEIHALLAGSLR